MRRADIFPDDIELLNVLLAASELMIAELNAGILERDEVIVARNDTCSTCSNNSVPAASRSNN